MAKVSYEFGKQFESENSNQSTLPGFFSLKNDGDEAIVRIMQDDVNSFEIVTTHQIQTENGRFRNVNCIRDPREPLEKCPFCNNGLPVRQRFYIKMIQYDKTSTGVVPKAVVWERSFQYVERLKSYLDNYGPLSDIICKIIRHGKAGDMKTTYEIIPNLNKQIFTDELYPKLPEAFNGYSAVGTTVLDKSFDELSYYVSRGQFPPKEAEQQSQQQIPPAQYQQPMQQQVPPAQYQQPAAQFNNVGFDETPFNNSSFGENPFTATNTPQVPPAQPESTGIQRPVRYY